MISKMCEWDQYVILDPEEGIKNQLPKKKFNNPSSFYYGHKKYSDINPLECLYEGDENEEYDSENDLHEINKRFNVIHNKNINIAINCVYWGEILVKSLFTGCMVYVLFII